jgi:hypothetical protein
MVLTDEQLAAELNHARSWSKRPGWTPQAGECESLADLALALQERLQAAEAESAKRLTAIHHAAAEALEATRRASVAEAERDEALREQASWKQAAIARREHMDDLTKELATARQQARREAFEEAAKLHDEAAVGARHRVSRINAYTDPDFASDLRDELKHHEEWAAAIRALAEGER